ncbi:MAG TPA: ABC transporter substrate-binding protein, partial [Candidatus Saccharimonadales bacterium]
MNPDEVTPQPQTPITPQPSQPPLEPTPPPVPPQPPAPAQKPGKSGKMLAILLGLLLLVAAAAGAYMLLHNSKAQDTATTTTQKHDIAQLTVGVAGGEITLDPLSGAHDSYLQAINMQVFESLVQYKDNTKLVPLLATGWSNPNNDTWVFNLRPNVLFHDGNTMTAADVAYSMKLAAADPDLSTTYASTIKDARALSGNRVEITTKQTDPFFLNRLSFLKVIDSKKPSVTDGSNGTGPYQLKAGTKPSDTTISLTAFNRYHAGHVYTKALTYIAEADEDSLSKDLKAGKVQFAGEYSSTKPDGVNVANYQSWTVSDPAVTFLALNSVASGPLQKLEVRQALRDSIDIPTMIKDLDLSAVPASQLMTKDIPGYNESLSVPKQDIVKAKSLLTTAGYPNG